MGDRAPRTLRYFFRASARQDQLQIALKEPGEACSVAKQWARSRALLAHMKVISFPREIHSSLVSMASVATATLKERYR